MLKDIANEPMLIIALLLIVLALAGAALTADFIERERF
jgi:hypothetical protein